MVDFTYVNLRDIDPDVKFKSLDEAVYNVKLLKVEARTSKAGKPYFSLRVAVTDDQKFAGRQLFSVMFPNDMTYKILRRIMDYTGIAQEEGMELPTWFERLSEAQPVVKVPIIQHEDRNFVPGDKDRPTGEPRSFNPDGSVPLTNTVRWIDVRPAF